MARVRVLAHLCKGCELCVAFCPKKALCLSEEVNARGLRVVAAHVEVECTGCGNCAVMCPDAAIVIVDGDVSEPLRAGEKERRGTAARGGSRPPAASLT